MANRYRRWTWTLNNYTEEDLWFIEEGPLPNERFIVVGKEVGASGTPHLQGYVEFSTAVTLGQLKKWLGGKAHLEASRGTAEHNIEYCSKENVWLKRGEVAKPGERKDLKAVSAGMAAGKGIKEMLLDGTMPHSAVAIKYAETVAKYLEPSRDWVPEVRWFWGEPGVGKSRMAREWLNDKDKIFVKTSGSGKWWDGYDGQPDILWDDFRDSQCSLTDLLGMTDRYEHRFEIKGGIRQCLARRIAITSIFPPSDMFTGAKGEPVSQILRRITEVVHVHVQRLGGNTMLPTSP